MDVGVLEVFNEWWVSKRVREVFLKPLKRPLYLKILEYLGERQVLLITGLRRVGKTTMVYQLIQHLLDEGVPEINIVYFSFDEQSADLNELVKIFESSVLKKRMGDEKVYFFLDEIQKCGGWQDKIKIFYDLHPNLKFVITGSASAQIDKRAKESLAGRLYDFNLEPLSFKEFVEWKGLSVDVKRIELYENVLNPVFYDYLRKGGFPELVGEESDEKIKMYVKNSVIEKIVYKDFPEEFHIKDYELMKVLIEMIARNPGLIINYDSLSQELRRNKRTVMNYIFYLQRSFLVRLVSNFRPNFMTSSKKMKKAYLTSTAISFALASDFYGERFMEKIVENFAVIQTNAEYYYRNSYEVDIIIKKEKILPIEVKYGKPETRQLEGFMKEYDISKAVLLTKNTFKEKKEGKKTIRLIPVWAFPFLSE
jgi:predicted AAA+ superfamily ATPase